MSSTYMNIYRIFSLFEHVITPILPDYVFYRQRGSYDSSPMSLFANGCLIQPYQPFPPLQPNIWIWISKMSVIVIPWVSLLSNIKNGSCRGI